MAQRIQSDLVLRVWSMNELPGRAALFLTLVATDSNLRQRLLNAGYTEVIHERGRRLLACCSQHQEGCRPHPVGPPLEWIELHNWLLQAFYRATECTHSREDLERLGFAICQRHPPQ